MTDILEMLFDGLTYADFAHGNAQSPHQFQSVLVGAVGGAETRHGDANNVGPGPTQFIHGFGGYQQSQGGIKAAGNTHDHVFATGMREAFGQALHLNGYDFFATLGEFGAFGHERCGIETAVNPFSIQCGQGKGYFSEHRAVSQLSGGKTGVFSPVVVEAFYIDVGRDELSSQAEAGGFGQQIAVFHNVGVAGKDHVGG